MGMAGPAEILSIQESRTFDPPSAGTKEITVQTKAQYIPEVIAAFPEFSESRKTEQTYLFEMTKDGITRLIAAAIEEVIPEKVLAAVPLDKESWELTYSQKAQPTLNAMDYTLVYEFELPQVGDYVNISRSIPGASPAVPFVSLKGLSIIEIEFNLQGQSPVTAEVKMVDDCGRTTGVSPD